jgi:PilZ domain
MENKRSDPRVPLIASAEVTEVASGTLLTARTSDLSRTGCYIDTLNPTPAKTIVRIRLTHGGEELDLPARIVYVSPGLGMGIRFDENLTPAQLAILDRWIADSG